MGAKGTKVIVEKMGKPKRKQQNIVKVNVKMLMQGELSAEMPVILKIKIFKNKTITRRTVL